MNTMLYTIANLTGENGEIIRNPEKMELCQVDTKTIHIRLFDPDGHYVGMDLDKKQLYDLTGALLTLQKELSNGRG